jgi:hypothetical protein
VSPASCSSMGRSCTRGVWRECHISRNSSNASGGRVSRFGLVHSTHIHIYLCPGDDRNTLLPGSKAPRVGPKLSRQPSSSRKTVLGTPSFPALPSVLETSTLPSFSSYAP